jgi:hypothetical protein
VNTLAAIASVIISAGVIMIVYRAAAQIAAIEDATERDLRDFPPTTPPTPAESIQEPGSSSERR